MQDAKLNSDLVIQSTLGKTINNPNETRFEHYIFIDDSHLKLPVPRRICLAKESMRHNKKSTLAGWDQSPQNNSTFSPKLEEITGSALQQGKKPKLL